MKCTNFYDACQKILFQARMELVAAVKAHGGRYEFSEDNTPCVMANPKYGGPADYLIREVSVDDSDWLTIKAECCEEHFGHDIEEIMLSDIAVDHLEFIISSIPETEEVNDVTILSSVPCVTLSRDDFNIAGFNGNAMSNKDFSVTAVKIGDQLVAEDFWDLIRYWGETLNLPKTK